MSRDDGGRGGDGGRGIDGGGWGGWKVKEGAGWGRRR